MTRRRNPLPPRAEVGPIEELEALLRFQSSTGAPTAIDRDLADAERVLEWYEELADDLAAGRRVPAGWPTTHATEIARLIHFHCVRLATNLERVEDVLADRERELPFLRANDTSAHYREQVAEYDEAFARRMRVERREQIRFLEIEQTRIMARDVGAIALLSGLALGSLGARIGADPFIQRATSQARIARGVALEKAERTAARNERWKRRDCELEADGDPNQSSRARTIAAEVSTPESPVTAEQVRRALYRGRKL